LPGLAEWARVRDYRETQINRMANVETFLDSRLDAAQVREFGADHVVIATGSTWRGDGVGRKNETAIDGSGNPNCFTPDDVIAGKPLVGPVIVFDDDHYYMGGVLAEKLQTDGHEVLLVTPAADVSHWTHNTMEQERIQATLLEMGVDVLALHNLAEISDGQAEFACVYTDRRQVRDCGSMVLVTSRNPNEALYQAMVNDPVAMTAAGIKSVTRIGDCLAPGTIAASVYSGHRYARELDEPPQEAVPFRRELVRLAEYG
jgi:dimethylamine/trimethylamine dehydrogenase